jgi:hypothetical protein
MNFKPQRVKDRRRDRVSQKLCKKEGHDLHSCCERSASQGRRALLASTLFLNKPLRKKIIISLKDDACGNLIGLAVAGA